MNHGDPGAFAVSDLTVVRGARTVVDGVSFAVRSGSVTALLGPNGAGKSSVLKAALGVLPLTRGSITVGDEDLARLSRTRRAQLVGYVPQRSQLNAPMPVAQVVALGRYAHQGGLAGTAGGDPAAVSAALAQVDGTELAARPFTELSAGEAQRVLLARALVGGARVVLMDEPTAALDIGHALAALRLIRRLADEGRTIVVVLHQLDEVRRVADAAVLLHHGRVLASGAPSDVLAPGPLRVAFGVEPDAAGAPSYRLVSGP